MSFGQLRDPLISCHVVTLYVALRMSRARFAIASTIYVALRIVAYEARENALMTPKNSAAVELGRRGGKARARKLTPEEHREAARKAVEARWAVRRQLFFLSR
jgi:hypothetical protein